MMNVHYAKFQKNFDTLEQFQGNYFKSVSFLNSRMSAEMYDEVASLLFDCMSIKEIVDMIVILSMIKDNQTIV